MFRETLREVGRVGGVFSKRISHGERVSVGEARVVSENKVAGAVEVWRCRGGGGGRVKMKCGVDKRNGLNRRKKGKSVGYV